MLVTLPINGGPQNGTAFLLENNRSGKECHAELCEILDVHVLLHGRVSRWVHTFRGGGVSVC
jgi:hypothetical protein